MSKPFSSTGSVGPRATPKKQTISSLMSATGPAPAIVSLQSLGEASLHAASAVSLSGPLFRPTPSVVRFAACTPFKPHTATLLLTNLDHVSRRVKLDAPADHHFRIVQATRPGLQATQSLSRTAKLLAKSQHQPLDLLAPTAEEKEPIEEMGSSKIAPGMSILYTIEFTPRDRSDYSCDLVVSTEREQFLVPIRATGDRPSIDMPSSLEFGPSPVYHPTNKPILVRNNGPVPTQFSFSVVPVGPSTLALDEPPPFTVEPAHGVLAVEETIQVIVSFAPNVRGHVAYTLVADISHDGVSNGAEGTSTDTAVLSLNTLAPPTAGHSRLGATSSMSMSATGSSFAALTSPITPPVAALRNPSVFAASTSFAASPSAARSNVLVPMSLTGEGRDVAVELEVVELTADPTYVGLRSQKTVLLHNHSDIPITFALKSLPSRSHDAQLKAARVAELREREAYEREHMDDVIAKLKDDESESKQHAAQHLREARYRARHEARRAAAEREGYEFDSSDDEQDMDGAEEPQADDADPDADPAELAQLDLLRGEQWIVRKFQRLHRALEASTLTAFASPHYSFDPLEGEIWPRGSKELTVTFAPDSAGLFPETVYVEVSGRLERLSLSLSGRGLGPEARFSYTAMDVGSVYMNAPHRYEITLQNIGNIPAQWRLASDKGQGGHGDPQLGGILASRFKFSPSEGVLAVTPGLLSADDEELSSSRSVPFGSSDRVTIQVDFLSGHIGEFLESIFFELVGNAEPLKLLYKGKVVGPTFHFEESVLDYGIVSYGFLNSRLLHLHNTSAIEMKVRLHIPLDGEFMDREFGLILVSNKLEDAAGNPIEEVEDDDGWSFEPRKSDPINLTTTSGNVATIPAFHHAQIQVDLVSESASKRYDLPAMPYVLLVDVQGVGEAVVTIPIKATCQVPMVSVGRPNLAFETVFLRHTYTQLVPLKNDTDLWAKFEVQPQDEHSKATATLEPEVYSANVAPRSTYQLKMLLTCHRLGSSSQPFYIQVPGSDAIPFVLHASFACRGPKVLLDSKALNFGLIVALAPVQRTLMLHNDSPIPARFKAFVHKKGSCYSVDIDRGVIAPHAKQPLIVTACLDETLPMADRLYVLVEEGEDLAVPLRATGTGTTVASTLIEEPLAEGASIVDHGDQLTNTPVVREFRLENRGRRTQILHWEFVPDLPAHARTGSMDKGDKVANPLDILSRVARMRKLGNDAELVGLPTAVFSISPAKITLEPNTALVFTLAGTGLKPGQVQERWICKSLVGQAKKLEVIYDTTVKCNFVTPMLSLGHTVLSFTQILDPKTTLVIPEPQTLSLTNKTSLPLRFRLKAPLPFALSSSEFVLEAGETGSTIVRFMPDITENSPYKKTSTKIRQELTVIYSAHPQRDRLVLLGELCYPNLTFSTTKVDFGSVLNETSKRILLTLTNHSALEATYRWLFSDKVFGKSETVNGSSVGSASTRRSTPTSGRRGTPNPTLKMGTDASSLPLNELFDILPVRGSLLPGESETVELTFYGHQELVASGLAICEVEGGPDYEVKLRGEASSVSYSLDCTAIQFGPHDVDFGPLDIFSTTWKEVVLTNDGRVAFDFLTLPQDPATLPLIECNPSVGRLKPGEKARLQVRFLSARPSTLDGVLQLQVACFDPVPISLTAAGVLPLLAIDLPTADEWIIAQPGDAPSLDEPLSPSSSSSSGSAFSVARHVADLGHVVKDTVSTLKFVVRNIGPVFASYAIDKKHFHSSIFSIEPTSVTRVPPGQSTTFTVVCRASNPAKHRVLKQDIFAGREFMLLAVPITVRNGPPMLLHVCAHVCVPSVDVSQSKLDFGRVALGQRREIAVMLTNPKAVPAVWTLGTPVGSNLKDKDCFEIRPNSGTLAPHEKVLVTVAYTPALNEERKSLVRIPLKVERNSGLINLLASGCGSATVLAFDPPQLRLTTTLPFGRSTPTPFRLVNHSDRAVEVYSLDFDRMFAREEVVLAGDEGFGARPGHPDLLFMLPRAPGDSLPRDMLQRHKLRVARQRRLEQEQAALQGDEAQAAEAGALVADAALVASALGNGLPVLAADEVEEDPAAAELVRNVLVVGAPYAGKSTFARSLLAKLSLGSHARIDLDAAVRYFAELVDRDAEETETLALREKEYAKEYEKTAKRLAKGRGAMSPDETHAAVVAEIGVADLTSALKTTPEERTLAQTVLSAITNARARLALEAQEAALAAKAAKKSGTAGNASGVTSPSKKGSSSGSVPDTGRVSPSPRPSAPLSSRTSRGGKGAAPQPSGLFEPDADLQEYLLANTFFDLRGQDVLDEDTLAEVLYRYVLIQGGATFRRGLVIDGLDSCFVAPPAAARVIRASFAKLGAASAASADAPALRENNLHIVVLDLARSEASVRLAASRARSKTLVDDEALTAVLKRFKVLSGRDIDKLTDSKRSEYERTLDLYARRREAEVALFQNDHLDPQRFEDYFGPEISAVSQAQVVPEPEVEAQPQPSPSKATVTGRGSFSALTLPEPVAEPVEVTVDPLAEVLSALDLPFFLPATALPPVLLPEEAVAPELTEEEQRIADEAEAAEAERAREQAAQEAAKAKEDAAKKGVKKSRTKSPSGSRSSSADGRRASVDSMPEPVIVPLHLQASKWDAVPVRASAMNGLPSVAYLKVRRFDSGENLARLVHTALPWIEEIFRVEVDPRTLDPNYIPPPVTYQLVTRPGLKPRRHVPTTGFVLVDPAIEEEVRLARAAADAADAKQLADEQAALAEDEARKKKGSKSASRRGAATEVAEPVVEVATPPVRKVATRWQIPAHSSIEVFVSFTADHVGEFASSLGFELVGGTGLEMELPVTASCAVPQIASDPRSIFMRKPTKALKAGAAGGPIRAYVASEKVFDFGAMLVGKDPDTRHSAAAQLAPTNGQVNNSLAAPLTIDGLVLQPLGSKKTNGDVWRISNVGAFATHIDLSFLMGVDSHAPPAANAAPVDPRAKGRAGARGAKGTPTGDRSPSPTKERAGSPSASSREEAKSAAKKTATAAGGKKPPSEKDLKALEKAREIERAAEDARWDVLRSKRVFIVEPCSFDLAVDESRDITVWAFPQAQATFCDTLVATIRDNPAPVQLPLRCTGAKPTLNLSTCDVTFERMLLAKEEVRTVDIVNTGPLPVAWSIAGLDQLPSADVLALGPVTRGILAAGAPPFTLTVHFKATTEQAFDIPLVVEARDVEGFLGVLDSIPLTIKCEAYQNKAHLDFATSGPQGGELAFDLLRVGDAAEQTFSLVNEGLYEVRYKLLAPALQSRAHLSGMFLPAPSEGVLAAHHRQDFLVACRPDREFSCARDLGLFKLQLFESGASAPTKSFAVPVTAAAVFSKFHVLPPTGVAFGAIETGNLTTRTIVLHNDGAFDFEYRFYVKSAAHPYSRVSVLARSEERERAESEGKGSKSSSSSSNKKKDQIVVPRLGSTPKPAAALAYPTAPAPIALLPPAKGGKKVAASTNATPRTGDKATASGQPSSRLGSASSQADRSVDRKASTLPGSSTPKGAKKGKIVGDALQDHPTELELGVFTLHDPCGFVRAGSSVELEVTMYSEAPSEAFVEALELEVSGTDPNAGLIPYELAADSCTPGVDTKDLRAIFEEQEVRPELARKVLATPSTEYEPSRDFFAATEQVFQFAPVLVHAPSSATSIPANPVTRAASPTGRGDASPKKPGSPVPGSARSSGGGLTDRERPAPRKKASAVTEVVATEPLPPVAGRVARFRIANPYSVPASVQLLIHSAPPPPPVILSPAAVREAREGGKKGAKGQPATPLQPKKTLTRQERALLDAPPPFCAFSLAEQALVIPPGEHRYVSVTFRPEAAQPYNAWFEALVDAGLDVATRSLLFELRGEGALPTLTVVSPAAHDEEGRPLLDFHRLFHGTDATATRTVTLRNDGVVPATARFDLFVRAPSAPALQMLPVASTGVFGFSGRGRLVTLTPGESASFSASFAPDEVGLHSGELKMVVVSNPSGGITVALRGEAYLQDVTVEAAGLETVPLLAPATGATEEAVAHEPRRGKVSVAEVVDLAVSLPLVQHLAFADAALSTHSTHVLTMVNHSDTPYRFAWTPPPPPNADALQTKRGKKSEVAAAASGVTSPEPSRGGGKKKEREAEEERKRAEEEAQRRSMDGSAAAANALALALAAAAGDVSDPSGDFVFTPSIGHLAPHSSKNITVTFRSGVVRAYVHALASCQLQRIRYVSPEAAQAALAAQAAGGKNHRSLSAEKRKKVVATEEVTPAEPEEAFIPSNTEWDNSQSVVRWITEAEARERAADAAAALAQSKDLKAPKGSKAAKAASGKTSARGAASSEPTGDEPMVQVTDTAPEPPFETLDPPAVEPTNKKAAAAGGESSRSQSRALVGAPTAGGSSVTHGLDLRLSACADVSRFELALTSQVVHFRPTFMFQTRSFSFVVRNPAATSLAYSWMVDPVGGFAADEDVEAPFAINPARGAVLPRTSQTFTLTFSPLAAREYRTTMRALIPDLNANQQAPVLELRGTSLRPKCHFELPPSDYLTAARRPAQLTSVVDPLTRVLEFKSLGVRVKNVRKFFVVNPTDVSYAFHWKNEDAELAAAAPVLAVAPASPSGASAPALAASSSSTALVPSGSSASLAHRSSSSALLRSPYKCLTPKGVIESGRKFEMIFEYAPGVAVPSESRWRFVIPNLESRDPDSETAPASLEVPFLLAGCVAEPSLELDRTFLNFHALIAGQKRTEVIHLVNGENTPFAWSVDRASLPPDNGVLTISPTSGVVQPHSKFALSVTLRPNSASRLNFNVQLVVASKPTKLSLNLKGEGYLQSTDLLIVEGDEVAERERRRDAIRDREAALAEAAAAAAAAAALAEQNVKSSRGSAGRVRKEKAAAAAAAASAPIVPMITLPAVPGATGADASQSTVVSPTNASQGPPLPTIPLGGLVDLEPLGFDLASARMLAPLPQLGINGASSSSALSIVPAHRIDFGSWPVHTRRVRHLLLRNTGAFHVDYSVSTTPSKLVRLTPSSGQVQPGHTVVVDIVAGSREEQVAHRHRATITIGGVKTYALEISGATTRQAKRLMPIK